MFIASHVTPLRQILAIDEVATGHCASKVEFFSCLFRSNGAIFLIERKLNDLVLSYFDAREGSSYITRWTPSTTYLHFCIGSFSCLVLHCNYYTRMGKGINQ